MRASCGVGPVLKRAIAAAATLAFVSIAFGGCAYMTPATSIDGAPLDTWYADDLPVPAKFVLDKDQSRMCERGHRFLKLVYKRDGYVNLDPPADFYKRELAARGWQLQFVFGLEQRGLIFWKNDEELRITLASPGSYVTSCLEVEPKDPTDATPDEVAASVGKSD